MSVSAGDDSLGEIREAKEGVIELGDEMVGGRIGMGWRDTSIIGSQGSEVTISRYLSHSWGDRDRKMGVNTGKRVSGARQVM